MRRGFEQKAESESKRVFQPTLRWDSTKVLSSGSPRAPAYFSPSAPFAKILSVGKPLTPALSQTAFSLVQSTDAIPTSLCPSYSAASFSHVGASDLQWPHQGA